MAQQAGRVVMVALVSNAVGFLFKSVCGALTGSAGLVAEGLHSLMATINQAVMHRQHKQAAGAQNIYAYGHGQVRYLLNFWVSVGLFSIGAGLGLAWGIYRLWYPNSGFIAADSSLDGMTLLAVLGALLLQGYGLFVTFQLLLERMQASQTRNPLQFLRDCKDITLLVLVVQSGAGLIGLLLIGAGVSLVWLSGNPIWDALAALLVGVLMGWVAFQLGFFYLRHLTDVRDPEAEQRLAQILEQRRSVHSCSQIHSMILEDNSTVLFVEIELTQEAMVAGMLKSISTQKQALVRKLPEDKRSDTQAMAFVTARSMVEAPLNRAGQIVADLEQQLREQIPRVADVSIRVRGISEFQLPQPTKLKPHQAQEVKYIDRDSLNRSQPSGQSGD